MIRNIKVQSLGDWVDSYELSHAMSEETARYYRRAIRTFEKWAQLPLTAENLTDHLVNGTLAAMQKAGKSPHYVRSLKSGVLAVWRDWADAGFCQWPRRIRPVRSGVPRVITWTPEDICRLLAATQQLPGEFRGLPVARAVYFDTLIRTAWDTGLRRRDLHQLRRADIRDEWVHQQHKTQKPVRVRLRVSTLERIYAWGRPSDAVLWPLWGSDEAFRATFQRIVRLAGVPKGPWKRIRKSAGTASEAAAPGSGHLLLGNTRRVFERHYLQAGVIAGPQPPELG